MLNLLVKLFSGNPRLPTDTGLNGQAPGSTALKYYLYLSQTKVDMLFPQVPADFLKGAEAEIKVNLGLASAALKSRRKMQRNWSAALPPYAHISGDTTRLETCRGRNAG